MFNLKMADVYDVVSFNGLDPDLLKQGIAGVPRVISDNQITFGGFSIINNDASVRYLQIFFKPASMVVPGTTKPDLIRLIPASGAVNERGEFVPFRTGTGISAIVTTTATGSTGATVAAVGEFYVRS